MAERPDPIAFSPVPVRRRRDGWTAERQVAFIEALAETGCVAFAARSVGMSARSAYRLAARADAREFAEAWDCALALAARALAGLAFRYASEGMVEQVWKDGVLVSERRRPSERLLIFLLSRLDPVRFGAGAPPLAGEDPAPRSWPERRLPELFEGFTDMAADEADEAADASERPPWAAPPDGAPRAR